MFYRGKKNYTKKTLMEFPQFYRKNVVHKLSPTFSRLLQNSQNIIDKEESYKSLSSIVWPQYSPYRVKELKVINCSINFFLEQYNLINTNGVWISKIETLSNIFSYTNNPLLNSFEPYGEFKVIALDIFKACNKVCPCSSYLTKTNMTWCSSFGITILRDFVKEFPKGSTGFSQTNIKFRYTQKLQWRPITKYAHESSSLLIKTNDMMQLWHYHFDRFCERLPRGLYWDIPSWKTRMRKARNNHCIKTH